MRALIVYGTRYGATTSTASEIAKVLRDGDFDVQCYLKLLTNYS